MVNQGTRVIVWIFALINRKNNDKFLFKICDSMIQFLKVEVQCWVLDERKLHSDSSVNGLRRVARNFSEYRDEVLAKMRNFSNNLNTILSAQWWFCIEKIEENCSLSRKITSKMTIWVKKNCNKLKIGIQWTMIIFRHSKLYNTNCFIW